MNDIQSLFMNSTAPEPQNTKYPAIFNKLTPPQQNTLNAAIDIINHHRAVLLYEMTGTGKTYVAAALAAVCQKTNACECIIIAPANLLNMWKTVAASFQMNAKFYSYQAASLQTIPAPIHDDALWLIDEAHMLKNPTTKRYVNLQSLMARHKICLITATPLSMGWQDLNALMVLCGFPHTHAQMDETWLRAFAIALMPQTYAPPLSPDASFSSTHDQIPYLITEEAQEFEKLIHLLSQIQWFTKTPDGALSDVRLLPHILIHRLLSHRNSCLITLQKLERYYTACRTHSSKQMLSRKDFFRMMGIEGKQQLLPFDELIWGSQIDESDKHHLNLALHNIQLARSMLKKICSTRDDKLNSLNQYIKTHPNRKIVIFTQYTDTANYLASMLNSSYPAALLTANQSLYKSYPVAPEILLAMFDPNMKLPDWWHETGQPDSQILICSDAFSCGHNFQKADTLIHFDLPWNPTTIKQREGRLLRKDQRHDTIQIHHMTLSNAPHLVKSYHQSLKNRLTAREQLQNQWFKLTPLPTNQFLFANTAGIPRIWARNNDFWIPVSSHSLPTSAKYMQLQQSTIAESFEITFHHLKTKYEGLCRFIKQYSHHPAIRNSRKRVFKAFYDMALFPQLQVNEFQKQKFTYSNSNRLCMKINAMPVESIPTPNTPCWKTTLYPQEAVVIAQDTHKLSTGYPTKTPSISPVFAVNTESST